MPVTSRQETALRGLLVSLSPDFGKYKKNRFHSNIRLAEQTPNIKHISKISYLGNTSLLSSLYFFNLTFSRDCTSNGTTSLPHLMMMSLQYRKGRIRYRTPKSKIISNSFFYKIIFKTSLTHLQMGHTNSCKNMQNSLKKYKIMFGT